MLFPDMVQLIVIVLAYRDFCIFWNSSIVAAVQKDIVLAVPNFA